MQRQVLKSIRVLLSCALTACVLTAALSCATAPPAPAEEDVRGVTELAAAGETEILTAQSHVPFLFDGEILGRGQDVAEMWRLIVGAGVFEAETTLGALSGVGPGSYRLFADSKQVELFFSKYVSENASTAVVETPAATVILLLDGRSEGYSRIAGMRVDVR